MSRKHPTVAVIGTRRPTAAMAEACRLLCIELTCAGYHLVTGNAEGIDGIARDAWNSVDPRRVTLVLPWPSYNRQYVKPGNRVLVYRNQLDWDASVRRYHPAPDRLSGAAFKLLARNYGIVSLADVVVAFPGSRPGGTAQGVRIARDLGKPLSVWPRDFAAGFGRCVPGEVGGRENENERCQDPPGVGFLGLLQHILVFSAGKIAAPSSPRLKAGASGADRLVITLSHHRFIIGHVLDALRTLPDESVHCVVTSPPYYGLRDYGLPPVAWPEAEYSPMPGLLSVKVPAWEGQLGLEPTAEMYVAHLVLVFREVRRVLRRDGTLWLNLGDSYTGSWGNYHPFSPPGKHGQRLKETARWNRRAYDGKEDFLPPTAQPSGGRKKKDLIGVPWRAVFALQADGWWLRCDAVWAKPNCLPESTKDRPTRSHEYVFLLAQSERYFYDAEAVAEPAVSDHPSGNGFVRPERLSFRNADGSARGNLRQWEPKSSRNRRSVWEINTEPFPGAHFAVFPRRLAEICTLAGTSGRGCCPVCGAPWERVAERKRTLDGEPVKLGGWPVEGGRRLGPQGVGHWRFATVAETVGWRPTCTCPGNDGSARCVVLDPFGGAGTVTLVAAALGRDSIYIDLKREYAEMTLERCGFRESKLFDQHTWEMVEFDVAQDVPACTAE